MLFRRIVLSALLVGLAAGLILSAVQTFEVIPIIEKAEHYEAITLRNDNNAHAGSTEHVPAWAPEGSERTFWTATANILASVGFAMLLISALTYWAYCSRRRVSLANGFLWGIAGYAVFFLAPALGLPPEIPGAETAPIMNRQLWWLGVVVSTAIGLYILAFAAGAWRWTGLAWLILPHLVGAPTTIGPAFSAFNSELEALTHSFAWATAVTNGIFWSCLGVFSCLAVRHIVKLDCETSS